MCGGTGAWSKPYADAGYDVRLITLPDYDVRTANIGNLFVHFHHKGAYGRQSEKVMEVDMDKVYGILAAPPCTMFSFARTNAKMDRDLKTGMECVRSCLEIIWQCMEIKQKTGKKTLLLKFWALENPYYGFLLHFLGKPAFTFDPWEFGDGYQKRTALWGYFNEPVKTPIPMTKEAKAKAKTNSFLHTLGTKFDCLKSKDIHPEHFPSFDRQTRRSITPAGFAKAFFDANQ